MHPARPEIVGLPGTSASGKDTAGNHLASLGYLHLSTGDVVKAEALRLYGTQDQYICRQVAHELRERNGAGALCLTAIENFQRNRDSYCGLVISGIRAVVPAQVVKDNGGLLIGLDAPIELRYARLVERGNVGESKNLEEFIQFERDESLGLETGQNLDAVFQLCDIMIVNDSDDIDAYKRRIEAVVGIN